MLKRYLLIILLFVAPFTYAGDGDPVIEGLTAGSVTSNTVTVQGVEGSDGILSIHADEGDNNEDKWRFVASASDKIFSVETYESGSWKPELLLNNTDVRILLGEGAGGALTTGAGNIFIGYLSGNNATEAAVSTVVGNQSGRFLTTGDRNTLIGSQAGYYNQTGNYNTAVGYQALYGVTGASNTGNTAIGNSALQGITVGNYNTSVGIYSMYDATTGGENVAVGYQALGNITTGDWNVGVGTKAGSMVDGVTENKTSTNSIYIGYQTQPYADGDTNEIVVGHLAEGNGSNTATWGNTSIVGHYFSGASYHGDYAGGNYAQVASDGTITLVGDARVLNAEWIDAGGIKSPGAKPATEIAHGALETPAWQFGAEEVAGNQETVSFNFRIPNRMDRSVAPTITIGISTTTIYTNDSVDNESMKFQLEYLYISQDEGTTGAAQETLTASYTLTASTVAEGFRSLTFTGIDLPSNDDVCIHARLTRLSADAGDTIADDIELHGICFQWMSNKLGS